MNSSTPGFSVLHYLPKFAQIHVHWVMMPSKHLILCCPLLFLPSIFPSIRIFFQWVSSLHHMAKKDRSFSISPSNEYSGLISFRIDWFGLLAVQGTLEFSPYPNSKALIPQRSAFFRKETQPRPTKGGRTCMPTAQGVSQTLMEVCTSVVFRLKTRHFIRKSVWPALL